MADRALNGISLCTGGGGLDLGVELCVRHARPVCYVEREAFAVARLGEAFDAGVMAPAPVHSDARTFDGRAWRGVVDWVAAGIPCQPWSDAGKQLGADDERDLRNDFLRIVSECEPEWVFGEQVASFLRLGYAHVRRGLEAMGYGVAEGIFRATEVGAPHQRARLFFLACRSGHHSDSAGLEGWDGAIVRERAGEQSLGPLGASLADAEGDDEPLKSEGDHPRRALVRARSGADGGASGGHPPARALLTERTQVTGSPQAVGDPDRVRQPQPSGLLAGEWGWLGDAGWWDAEPDVGRVADGVADRVDRLRMLGNGVVPLQAAHAYRTLGARHFGACWTALTL